MKTRLPYTPEESASANREWQATCGHHSIAAACQVSLDVVKSSCPKLCGWMSPTLIHQTLGGLGRQYQFREVGKLTPESLHRFIGLMDDSTKILRIQWEGSWLNPGVPVGAAYQRTHYIAAKGGHVMDTMRDPNIWIPFRQWLETEDLLVLSQVKKATGWHFSHVWILVL